MSRSSTDPQVEPRYLWGTRLFLAWFLGILAEHTCLTHLAQVFGLSFRFLALASSASAVTVTCALAVAARGRLRRASQRDDGWASWIALALIALAGALGLLSFRPDTDDYYYVPAAVHALEHPGEPMDFRVRGLIEPAGVPLVSHNFSTSVPYEYLAAVLAWALKVEVLAPYYFVLPVLVSCAIAASLLYLAGQLRLDPLATVLGCAVGLAALLAMGETHWAYGNFTFARAFHGKTLLLSCGVPTFAAATIEFFRAPRPKRWLFLAAIATAMIGVTATAIVLVPLLGLVLVLGVVVVEGVSRSFLRKLVFYALSSSYVIGYAACYLATGAARGLGLESAVNAGFPKDYVGHLRLMIRPESPVWLVLALGAAIVFFRLARREARVFVACWGIAVVVLFLNPLAASLLIEHVTSPNIYWRLFYLLPMGAFVAAAATVVLDRFALRRSRQLALASALILGLLALQVAIPATSVLQQAHLGAPKYKLPPETLAEARALIDAAPSGPMLAPAELAGIVPMLSSRFPQVLRRGEAEFLWLDAGRFGAATARRLTATTFAGRGGNGLRAYEQVIGELQPVSLVLTPQAWQSLVSQGGAGELQDLGYGEPIRVGRLLLLTRRSPAG
jgi:Family of unknown function (DUF6077)